MDSKPGLLEAILTFDQNTVVGFLRHDDEEVRAAARDRLSKLRWSTPEKVRAERIRNYD